MCTDANYNFDNELVEVFKKSLEEEISQTGKGILKQIVMNAEIAREEDFPLCQDTGFAVVFMELGQDVHVTGGYLYDAISEGVRTGYKDLRKSIVRHPLIRENTRDNTPPVIHTKIVSGDKIKITLMPKGGGGENASGLTMLKPSEGVDGVKNFVLKVIKDAKGNPCPPVVVGVGIGGTFEKVALLAKKALMRPIGEKSAIPDIARLEEELLKDINKTGIGPQGIGGRITAVAVNIEIFPAHIASLPVAVNINCHVHRHKSVVL